MWHDIVSIKESSEKIGHDFPVITMGSCFAEEVGKRMQIAKFNVLNNPAGTLYNPVSLDAIWLYLSGQIEWDSTQAYERDGIWFSFDHHSSIYGRSIQELEDVIGQCHHRIAATLKPESWLILTLGSAWVYNRKDNGLVVANCHKAPSNLFEKQLLTVEQCSDAIHSTITTVKQMNPSTRILLTLSPVRHKRDGFHENQLSKATLLLAIEEIVSKHNHVFYFPSYEIALDELRDYRFYAADRSHLTAEATDYIFNRFERTFMTSTTIEVNEMCRQIARDLAHRPIVLADKSIKQHHQKVLEKIDNVRQMMPELDFQAEINWLHNQI